MMEYYLKNNIADVIVPQQLTLAGNPAFAEFRNKAGAVGQPVEFTLIVRKYSEGDDMPVFKITEIRTKQSYRLEGTANKQDVNKFLFYVDTENPDPVILAENIRDCLMKRPFFRNNFELLIPFVSPVNDESRIEFRSKGCGARFTFSFELQSDSPVIDFEGDPADSENPDTIAGDAGNCLIELDIYTDTGIFLGENDLPADPNRGKYLASLTKSYFDKRIWFNLNALLSHRMAYSAAFLHTTDWCDTGTICDYRFIAKRKNELNSERFYCSPVMYIVNGYDYTLNDAGMNDFVFDVMNPHTIKPLTNRPATTHTKGQKQYFNFILKDGLHSLDITMTESNIGLLYKFYTQSGEYTGEKVAHEKNQRGFNVVNTIGMALDELVAEQEDGSEKKVGRVEVFLCCKGIEVSEAIVFNLLPGYLHTVNDFAFLNRLGGWDSFNFGGTASFEFKTVADTIHQTLLPGFSVSDRIESVEQRFVEEQKVARTWPVNRQTIEWLRELSASKAVYELKTKRYVIVDEFTLKYNSKDELFQAEMKYRY
ncbi:hypothetical protein [Viscerimonas tarda]